MPKPITGDAWAIPNCFGFPLRIEETLNTMKTLIITVGTRQVGSLFQDLYDWGLQQLQSETIS